MVDDDHMVQRALSFSLGATGFDVRPFLSGIDFVKELTSLAPGGVLLDLRMPDMDGFAVLNLLRGRFAEFPVVVMTGHGDVVTTVRAMKAGASDFIEKPFADDALLEVLKAAFDNPNADVPATVIRSQATTRLEILTPRELDVLRGLVAGLQNKSIAYELSISARTVEMHRASLMSKLRMTALSNVLRLAFAANIMPLDRRRAS